MTRYYSQKILDRFMNPRHMGRIENADGVGGTQNLRCGDIMKIYIKVGERQGEKYIKDIKFETLGCGHAIAISDMICQLAKDRTIEQAKSISFEDIASQVGEVPKPKLHCIRLAETALKSAIKDYEKKQKTS